MMSENRNPDDAAPGFKPIGGLMSKIASSPNAMATTTPPSSASATGSATTGSPTVAPPPPSSTGTPPGEIGSGANPTSAVVVVATPPDRLPARPSALESLGLLIADPPPERWDPPISMDLWWSRNTGSWTTARPIMEATIGRLESLLMPVSEAEIRRQLYRFSLGFAKSGDDAEGWADTSALYLEQLEGYAAAGWAHALRAWVRARHTFYPSIGELYGLLEDWTAARRVELGRLRRLAELEPPPAAGPCATLGEVVRLRAQLRISEKFTSEPRRGVKGRAFRKGPPPPPPRPPATDKGEETSNAG